MPERPWYQTESNSKERVNHYYSLHPMVENSEGKPMLQVAGRNERIDLKEIVFDGVYSEDEVELERRFKLLSQDSIYLRLGQKWRVATKQERSEQERSDLFRMLSDRARQIFIVKAPEEILNDPESFRPKI